MLLDKNAILGAQDLKRETVPVPEWGEGAEVIVSEMTALDRDRLRKDIIDSEGEFDPVNHESKMLVRCLLNPDGSRMFADSEAGALGGKSTKAIQRLYAVAQKLNAVYEATEETAKN